MMCGGTCTVERIDHDEGTFRIFRFVFSKKTCVFPESEQMNSCLYVEELFLSFYWFQQEFNLPIQDSKSERYGLVSDSDDGQIYNSTA